MPKPRLFSTVPVIRHSFATPLTNIILNTEIAFSALRQTRAHTSSLYLKRVLLNARYLQSVLKLSETAETASFSPVSAVRELTVLNSGTQLKKHLISRIAVEPSLQLEGSRLTFQEMLVCLLNNAYESYAPRQQQRLIFLNILTDKNHLILTVADGGQGMNWLTQKLSTSQLYSTKQNHSGLGLHFVKKAAEQEFRGQFTLKSRLKKGTSITLRLPIRWNQPVSKSAFRLQY